MLSSLLTFPLAIAVQRKPTFEPDLRGEVCLLRSSDSCAHIAPSGNLFICARGVRVYVRTGPIQGIPIATPTVQCPCEPSSS